MKRKGIVLLVAAGVIVLAGFVALIVHKARRSRKG